MKIQKPAWLIFGEQCRERIKQMPLTKSGKHEEPTIFFRNSDLGLRICSSHAYPGTEYDWYCLLGWRGRR